MLTRKLVSIASLVFLTIAIGLIYTPSKALAAPGHCDDYGNCSVGDGDGGDGGGKGGGGDDDGGKAGGSSSSSCVYNGKDIPCATGDGRWSHKRQCYVKETGEIAKPDKWDDMTPEEKAKWQAKNGKQREYSCTKPGGGKSTFNEDPGDVISSSFPPVNPEDLAREALAKLKLTPIDVGIAPKTSDVPKDQGIVGMPIWLWADNSADNTTGPASSSASDQGITVNLKAKVGSYKWSMGDGKAVRCNNEGTPWKKGMTGDSPSGCGYNYLKSGKYDVTATTTWNVEWEGGGMRGTITLPLTSDPETMHVTEAQTVVVN